ncbi:threonine synthase [Bryobacter aggregatus]|uniref:threonine synthase n=1 Tax=Bryobacter aggregatus TaxID=360054 RepID=UPI0004E17BD5|nr:threonine synthase [Bryobacter aggregatus]
MTTVSHLECSGTGKTYPANEVRNLSPDGWPLLVRYDLEKARDGWNRDWISSGPTNMWRYAPVLPVSKPPSIVTLGEGMTPLVRSPRLGAALGAKDLWIKDEGLNPTASFKARGLSCAISMCKELGIQKIAIPSAGNAASASAAYAAAAGIECHIFMPQDVPHSNYIECKAFGAEVTLVDGLISDCARIVGERKDAEGWFEVSTLKEPYRIEGKKTMGYELAEQLQWRLPDVILYPTGGGVGLIGMWKAFEEMEALGWILPGQRPKMIAVQAEGCQPVVKAFAEGAERSVFFENAHTVSSGLRVPKPLGDFLILRAIRESGGTAIAISDDDALSAGAELARLEGMFVAPEGAACVAAVRKLLVSGFLDPSEKIVIYNTGAGLKYLEAYSTLFPR